MELLTSLLQEMPQQNDPSLLEREVGEGEPDLSKLLERIRARFRQLCTSFGMPTQSDVDAQVDTNKPALSKLGGQWVDVTQLKY